MTTRTRHPRFTRGLLIAGASLAGTALSFAVLEFAAGFLVSPVVDTHGRAGEIAGDTISRTLANLDLNPAPLVADPVLLWSNAPDVRKVVDVNPRPWGTEDKWRVETDSEGYRVTPGSAAAAAAKEAAQGAATPAPLRILCIGDSITFGFNVDQPDTWPARLLAGLRQRHGDVAVEVINAGVPGWSWIQGLRYLETRGLALHPDVVLMSHGTNDQFFEAKVTDEERLRMLGGPVLRGVRRLLLALSGTNLFHVLRTLSPSSADDSSSGCRAQVASVGYCRRVAVDQVTAAVEQAARLVGAAGATLVVVNNDFLGTAAGPAARAGAERAGVEFVDAVGALATRKRLHDESTAKELGLALPAAEDESLATVPRNCVLRVRVPQPSLPYRVEGNAFLRGDVRFAADLHDDGRDGDERAGDSVWSAAIEVPAGVSKIEYRFHAGDVPEFLPLPPLQSTMAARVQAVGEAGAAPVEEFGRSWFMAEQVHPNARGQQAIADLVIERIEKLPSLGTRLQAPGPRAGHGESK